MKIASYAESFGGPHAMEPAWIDFIDNWEVENYRRKVASSASGGRVEGKTIIVTGAAQGFGQGIAQELLKQGANIVVADLNDVTGNATVEEFNKMAKNNKAIFVKTNVGDLDSLASLMKETIVTFGALDVFVSNAGVVRAGGLEQLDPKDFDFVTKINYYAFFYCSRLASHIMKLETAADPEYFADITLAASSAASGSFSPSPWSWLRSASKSTESALGTSWTVRFGAILSRDCLFSTSMPGKFLEPRMLRT